MQHVANSYNSSDTLTVTLILLLSSRDRLIRLNQEILKRMERVLGLSYFLRSQLFFEYNRSANIFSTHCQLIL